ncbi:MAG: hypothetical protein MUE55_07340 [Thermoplasmata archaeon]|nr:hypothetical protein [Thermoplasmata archaeon]
MATDSRRDHARSSSPTVLAALALARATWSAYFGFLASSDDMIDQTRMTLPLLSSSSDRRATSISASSDRFALIRW